MKILELTNYSAGSCGVFARVKKEALWLSEQGHQVRIFSSNLEKGTNEIVSQSDLVGKVKITRFPSMRLGGESFMRWNFTQAALDFKPDLIIAHGYRHYHTALALKVAKKLGVRCFLVTHAPFTMNTRSFFARAAVSFYDALVGPKLINKFDRVIAITNWEMQNLQKLGCKKDKISYIPNGIPEEFYASNRKSGNGFFFLGRVSPIKNIELLIGAVKNQNVHLDIIGPAENQYRDKLLSKIKEENIKNVHFLPEIKDLKSKIRLIDNYEVLVLPSKFESFGQVIIEAMARGKIVISSNTPGAREIISSGKNGFLFDINNSSQLESQIKKVNSLSLSAKNKIRKAAIVRSQDFKASNTFAAFKKLI